MKRYLLLDHDGVLVDTEATYRINRLAELADLVLGTF